MLTRQIDVLVKAMTVQSSLFHVFDQTSAMKIFYSNDITQDVIYSGRNEHVTYCWAPLILQIALIVFFISFVFLLDPAVKFITFAD